MTNLIEVTKGLLTVAEGMSAKEANLFLSAALPAITRQPRAAKTDQKVRKGKKATKKAAKAAKKPSKKAGTKVVRSSYATDQWFDANELFSLFKEKYADRFPWKQVKKIALQSDCSSADDLDALLSAIPDNKNGNKVAKVVASKV